MDREKIDELGQLDLESKRIKSILEKGKAEIKAGEDKVLSGNFFKAVVTERTSNKFNEELCYKVAKENGLDFLFKEVVDLQKLEDAIIGGEIDTSLFKECITESTTKAVSFKKK